MGAPPVSAPPVLSPGAHDLRVPSSEHGQPLFVRHKPARKDGHNPVQEPAPIVFVHGATFPGSAVYDAQLPGGSWMDYVAARGYPSFALDVRGYGQSWQPAPLNEAASRNPPLVHTRDAVQDLADVVAAVQASTGARQVNLVGWSWGTAICGGYASTHPESVRSVALFAPLWIWRDFLGFPLAHSPLWPPAWASPWIAQSRQWVGAWRDTTAASARQRQVRGLLPELAQRLLPQPQFEQWWAQLEADGLAVRRDGPMAATAVRAPNGILADLLSHWATGRSTWDASQVRAPTLLVAGALDVDTPPAMARELYQSLTGAADRQLVTLDKATHWMPLQANRFDLYRSIQNFIDIPRTPARQATAVH